MGDLGRVAGGGYDAEAARMEGLGEGVTEAAFGAAGDEDCLGGGAGGWLFDDRHGVGGPFLVGRWNARVEVRK